MFEDIINFFKGKNSERKSGNSKPSPIVITVCCLAIILPTLFAIFYAYFYEDRDELKKNTLEIQLQDADDVLLYSETTVQSNITESPFCNALYGMVANKQSTENAKKPFPSPNFKLTLKSQDTTEKYLCYFTESHTTSYIQNPAGSLFAIDEESHTDFMNLEYAEPIYSTACPPTLLTGDNEQITPAEVNWSYQKKNGKFVTANSCTTTDEILTYRIGGAVNIAFASAPDECTTRLYNSDKSLLFEGKIEDLPFVTLEAGETILTQIDAKWKKSDSQGFYGEATYEFNIILVNKAEFTISADNTQAGGFVILSVKNADSLSKIFYSPLKGKDDAGLDALTPEDDESKAAIEALYAYTPHFVTDEDYSRAIIPFQSQLPDGSFSFSLSYGASKQEFTVNISARHAIPENSFNKDLTALYAALSEAGTQSLQNSLTSVSSTAQDIIMWRGGFGSLESSGFYSGYDYGSKLTSTDELASFNAIGNEYISSTPGGQSVGALNIGVVLKVGECSYLGKYVVVEHGMGLRTWYCGLSTVTVNEGDILSAGQSVGRSGETSLTSDDGVLLLCTVYDTLIDPDMILGQQILIQSNQNEIE